MNAARRPRGPRLKGYHVNLGQAASAPHLKKVARRHRPKVIHLTEAYRIGPWAREHLRRYELVQYGREYGAEGPDTAVLVRRPSRTARAVRRVTPTRLLKMAEPWWGPFRFPRSRRSPRRYLRATVKRRGVRWPSLTVHLPSGGPTGGSMTKGKNAAAWHESADRTRTWLEKRELGYVVGDPNAGAADVREHIAPPDARVRMATHVDGLIVKGAKVVRFQPLPAPRGMHGSFLFTLEKETP